MLCRMTPYQSVWKWNQPPPWVHNRLETRRLGRLACLLPHPQPTLCGKRRNSAMHEQRLRSISAYVKSLSSLSNRSYSPLTYARTVFLIDGRYKYDTPTLVHDTPSLLQYTPLSSVTCSLCQTVTDYLFYLNTELYYLKSCFQLKTNKYCKINCRVPHHHKSHIVAHY